MIEFLASLRNIYIQLQNINQMSQKGQTAHQLLMQIDATIVQLYTAFGHVLPVDKLQNEAIDLEVREFIKVLANIINRLQSLSGVATEPVVLRVSQELRSIQLVLQQSTAGGLQDRFQFVALVRRAAIVVENLIWTLRPDQGWTKFIVFA